MYIAIGYICVIDFETEIIGNIGFLAPLLLSLIVILLESYINKLNDDFSSIFIMFLEAIAYILLFAINPEARIVIAFLYTIVIYMNALMNKQMAIIPIAGLAIILIFTDLDSSILNILKLVYIIMVSVITFKKPKLSIETLFSGIMLISFLNNYKLDSITGISITWALYNYVFSKNEKESEIFRFMTYAFGLALYCSLIYETEFFGEYKSVYFMGITVFAAIVSRTIFSKHMSKDSIDGLEYLIFSFIYLAAIIYYADEFDGMIFVVFLAVVTGFSFYWKDGKIFVTSIGAIIVNVLLLTRDFWFTIPWWMYLMGLGIGLLAFAITNEKRANIRKTNNKNFIERIKDKVEEE